MLRFFLAFCVCCLLSLVESASVETLSIFTSVLILLHFCAGSVHRGASSAPAARHCPAMLLFDIHEVIKPYIKVSMFEEVLLDNHGPIIILVLGPLVRTEP
jgi:hypothetical protein